MKPLSILTLFILTHHPGFSQEKKFRVFTDQLNNYKADNNPVMVKDSAINWDNYKLVWTHVRGTYGGSAYSGKGNVFEGDSFKNSLLQNGYLGMACVSISLSATSTKLYMIGNKYIIAEDEVPEPLPTSAMHFVYITRYFSISKKETAPR